MKFRNIAFAAFLWLSLSAFPKGSISGLVLNQQTGEPMDFVNVQLFDASTKKPLPIGAMTDENGNFLITDVADGPYIVKISNIGSVPAEIKVNVDGGNVTMEAVRLADDSKLLQEVVVEGSKSQMKFELDKKVFTVDSDIASTGLSASEVLESIPSVEVDQDGEVSLRGNTSVTVWINGKESGLSADNRAQILEQIPGESIEKIEVITNPSAKYSPEGTAGIINIVLKKDVRAGYYGSAELGINSQLGGNANFNINYNSSKWDLYGTIGFRLRNSKGGSLMRRDYDNDWYLNYDGESKNRGGNLFFRAGATYRLTEKDEFYINGFAMLGRRTQNSTTDYVSNLPNQWNENTMWQDNIGKNRGFHAEAGYKRIWGDNHSLDIMGAYNFWGGPNTRTYHERHVFPDDPEVDDYNRQEQSINVSGFEAKIDYVQQLAEWLKLEAGYNGNYGLERTPVSTYAGASADKMELWKDLYNNFYYRNNISALYFTLGGKVKKFSFSAGLRGEAWQVYFKSLGYGAKESDTDWNNHNFFALFPSAFVSYELPHNNELQVNYTRRIRRPWGGQLNPFRDISDPTNVSFGNPELEPQYANSFELNYIKNWTMHTLSVSAYLRTADNKMERISYLDTDVLYTTFYNVGREMNSGLELVGKNSFWRGKIDLTTTVNLYSNNLSAWETMFRTPEGKNVKISGNAQNSFAWDARMMFSIKLPWSLSFQATGRYASKQLSAQGSRQPGWSVDAGLRKTLGNWSFSLSARDIFDSRRFKNTVNYTDPSGNQNYVQYTERWRGGRRIQLTVKYSFGNMKKKPVKNMQPEPIDGSGYGDMGDF